jgi:hypothetical protein
MYYYAGSLKPVIYNAATNTLLLFDGTSWKPITNFTPSTCTNSDTNLNSCCDTLKSAFLNNDPSNQPILRAVYMNSSAPSNPTKGTTWLDTSQSTPTLKVYDGSNWQAISGGSSSNNRVDLSNATSDYNLDVGQEAIINFNNATSVPLHIATQSGTYYEMDVVLSNPVGTNTATEGIIVLNPNNTTYSSSITFVGVFGGSANLNTATNAIVFAYKYDAFRIGYGISSIKAYITNFTTNKHIDGIYFLTGISNSPYTGKFSSSWNDTTTNWTSLGTISFPQSSSGYIIVRRLA